MAEVGRRDFVSCCALGLCSTALVTLPAGAEDTPESRAAWLESRLDGARVRYAKLVGILSRELDPSAKRRVFRALGRECAIEYKSQTWEPYKGDVKGFLKMVQGPDGWVEKAEYDEKAGTIRVIDRAKKCTCTLVSEGKTPGDHCDCTVGWQTETYSRILGRPVEVELEESLLRGGKRCVYVIKVKA